MAESMKHVKQEFGGGKYYVDLHYRESANHVGELKVGVVIRDTQNAKNIGQYDDSHPLSDGCWPFHRHTETGRHYQWDSTLANATPSEMFVKIIGWIVKDVAHRNALDADMLPQLAGTLVGIWIQVRSERSWQ